VGMAATVVVVVVVRVAGGGRGLLLGHWAPFVVWS
jgi:hypothetical protein